MTRFYHTELGLVYGALLPLLAVTIQTLDDPADPDATMLRDHLVTTAEFLEDRDTTVRETY